MRTKIYILNKRLLVVLSVSILLFSCTKEDNDPIITPEPEEPMVVSPYFYGNLLFINHRGQTEYPENTFAAVNAAILSGFKAVECDICMTKDSIFVLQHDPTIDRCSDGTGTVNEMTYEELLSYDFGSWKGDQFRGERILRLDDLLDYFKAKGLIIELDLADETRFKREWIPVLYTLVKRKGMLGQTMFTATYDELEDFLSEPRDIIISVSGVNRMSNAQQALLLKEKVTLCNFSLYKNDLTRTIADFAHENGAMIKCWTTTTKAENDRRIRFGADYIITEVPYSETQ